MEFASQIDAVQREISMLRGELMLMRSMMGDLRDQELPGKIGWPNQVKWVEGAGGGGGTDILFSFKTTSNGDNTATMEPGDVVMGPDTTIAWASFTGESTTVTLDAAATDWYAWLIVDMSTESVSWNQGASITALSGDDLKIKMNVPLVKITADGGTPAVITGVKQLQCGQVLIPRS